MPNSRLASLGGYGVVLDVPDNPYASAAENYINSFVNSSTKLYGGFDERGRYTVGVIVQNIAKNEKIIEQQKAIYKAIEKTLPTGMTMSDLLSGKYVQNRQARSNSMKLYNKASTKDIKATSEQLSQARKRVERRTNIFHKNFQKANDLMRKAVANYGTEPLEETKAKVDAARKQASTLIAQGFIEAYQSRMDNQVYIQAVIDDLTQIQNTLTGRKDTIEVSWEGEQVVITGIEDSESSKKLANKLTQLRSLIKDLEANGGYKTKRNKSEKADITKLRFKAEDIKYIKPNGAIDENQERLYKIQQILNTELPEILLSFFPNPTTRQRRQASRITTEMGGKVQVSVQGGANKVSLPAPSYGTREQWEGDCLEYVVSNPAWIWEEAPMSTKEKCFRNTQSLSGVRFIHTGKDKERLILKKYNGKMEKNQLSEKVSDMGTLLQEIEENTQKMAYAAKGAATAMEKGRIDSFLDLEGTKYYIAFSDKFYNPKSIARTSITDGSIYTNLTSIDSGFIPGSKINNKVLYLLLLNLANVAWYYQHDSDNTREKVKQTIQQLLMQNFLSLSFGPENLMSAYDIDKKDVLYVHHISGSIIPVYTTLEVINRYLTKFIEGQGDQLANRSPIKVNIEYSTSRTGMDLWKESLEQYPGEKGNDPNKDARWQYVASWVAKDTSIELKYNLIAFDALYQGFYS